MYNISTPSSLSFLGTLEDLIVSNYVLIISYYFFNFFFYVYGHLVNIYWCGAAPEDWANNWLKQNVFRTLIYINSSVGLHKLNFYRRLIIIMYSQMSRSGRGYRSWYKAKNLALFLTYFWHTTEKLCLCLGSLRNVIQQKLT